MTRNPSFKHQRKTSLLRVGIRKPGPANSGAAAIIHTDIERDGTLSGPNIGATKDLAARLSIPVIASGGVASIDDIKALKNAGNIAGVIVGRALYDGKVELKLALQVLKS